MMPQPVTSPGTLDLASRKAMLVAAVEDHRDEDGRPLGEGRASRHVREGVPFEHRQCPFSGSRSRHENPMNVSAFKQLSRDWPQILGAVQGVRAAYVERHHPQALTLDHYWRIATATEVAAAFLIFRERNPTPDGRIPAFVASLNKICVGLTATCRVAALSAMMRGEDLSKVLTTAERMHETAEASGLLVGPKEVCAAPPQMIDEVLRMYFEGTSRSAPDTGPLSAYFPDLPALLDYAEVSSDLVLAAIRCAILMVNAREEIDAWLRQTLPEALPTPAAQAREPAFGQIATYTVVHDMKRLPAEARRRVAAMLAGIAQTDLAPPAEPIPPPSAAVDVVAAALLARAGAAGGPTERAHIASVIVSALALERWILRVIGLAEQRIATALGRSWVPAPLERSGLVQMFGRTPIDVLGAALGWSACCSAEMASLELGAGSRVTI